MSSPVRLCFVCLGNICRSPTAEGIMLHLVRSAGLHERFVIDSAGTGGWHAGEPADPRSLATARARGVDLPSRARQFVRDDFARFDYILCMDTSNYRDVHSLAAHPDERRRIYLLRDFDAGSPKGASVPDPYYGGPHGFDNVFDICAAACTGLLDHLRAQHNLG